ncbi:MAG: NAD(P)-dependent glycerol-3-phosphate dehydrogenase, partial [Erysipelotrichaceae bacterium]|nr:NAD(P)-dependent glycerol-3-phosphate dehydrogenase [Erysipelotrichaceae bacterium]
DVDVTIYSRSKSEVDDINLNHRNSRYFPEVDLNPLLKATDDLSDVSEADAVLLAVPSGVCCEMAERINQYLTKKIILINVAKGFHPKTHQRLSVEIGKVIDPKHFRAYCSLVGPSFAEEVVVRKMTTINMVSEDQQAAGEMQKLFSNSYFRVYTNSDMIGCEYASGLKNIIAIASGILHGLQLGENAKASLLTRGLAEMSRFAVARGARIETFMGLCGMGDLILTCTSPMSRNFTAGYQIGKENSSEGFWKQNKSTVEGVAACKIIAEEARKEGISMPITEQVYEILFNLKRPSDALKDLMSRDLKPEIHD